MRALPISTLLLLAACAQPVAAAADDEAVCGAACREGEVCNSLLQRCEVPGCYACRAGEWCDPWARLCAPGSGEYVPDAPDASAPYVRPPPKPDATATCDEPRKLTFEGDVATALVDTTGAPADDFASCGGSGAERVLTFTLTQTRDVEVTAASKAAAYSPLVYLRRTCGSGRADDELGCADSMSGTARLLVRALPAGTWWLTVDGTGQSAGLADVTVKLLTPGKPEACDAPLPLAFRDGAASVEGNTSGGDDASGTCGGAGRGDVVYEVVVPWPRQLNLDVTALEPGFEPALYLRKACSSPAASDELACAVGSGGRASTYASNLAAGRYFVWVDGAVGDGRFRLDARFVDPVAIPANDTCPAAQPLVFHDGVAVASASARYANTDLKDDTLAMRALPCSQGADVFYAVDVAAPSDLDVAVTGRAYLTLLTRCGLDWQFYDRLANFIACTTSSLAAESTNLSVPHLLPGRYFLAVAGPFDAAGQPVPFDLRATLKPASPGPANETCATAATLQLAPGRTILEGDSSHASMDLTGAYCSPATGRDLVWAFDLAAPQKVTVTLPYAPIANMSGGDIRAGATVVLRDACDLPRTDRACSGYANESGTAPVAVAPRLEAGRHYLVLEDNGTGGPFRLWVDLAAPAAAPAGDDCRSPVKLSFVNGVATHTSSTAGALRDASSQATCFVANPDRTLGADVVYELTLTSKARLTASAVGGARYLPLYLRAVCDSPLVKDERACGMDPGIDVPSLDPGTYYLWVDGNTLDGAAFTLTVKQEPPAGAAGNDACASAATLTPYQTFAGSTFGAADSDGASSFPSSCAAAQKGLIDVVYRFAPPADGTYVVTVTPTTAAMDPSVWIASGQCGEPSACVAAANDWGAGAAERLALPAKVGTTYFVMVESPATQAGNFTIEAR